MGFRIKWMALNFATQLCQGLTKIHGSYLTKCVLGEKLVGYIGRSLAESQIVQLLAALELFKLHHCRTVGPKHLGDT